MNKFVQLNNNLYEIRSDRIYRWFARLEPFEALNGFWTKDSPIDNAGSWEKLIESGRAEVINIEQFIEMNFENLL
jgi:hypothetical protein